MTQQHQNGHEMAPQMLHHYQHQVITKPEFPPAFYQSCSSLPPDQQDQQQQQQQQGLMLANVSGLSQHPHAHAAAAAHAHQQQLQNGVDHGGPPPPPPHPSALSPPQHNNNNTPHRHKRMKRSQIESMSSVDEDQESLQVGAVNQSINPAIINR